MEHEKQRVTTENGRQTPSFWLVLLAGLFLSMLAAGLSELVMNRHLIGLPEDQRGKSEITFSVENNKLHASFDSRYIHYLTYEYRSVGSLEANITVGETTQFDYNHRFIRTSTQRIARTAACIDMDILYGMELSVERMYIDNTWHGNFRRDISVFLMTFCLFCLLAWGKFFAENPERAFLLVGAVMGTVILLCSSAAKTVWDEGVHFKNAYTFPLFGKAYANETIETIMDDKKMSHINLPQSGAEYDYMWSAVNESADYVRGHEGVRQLERRKFQLVDVGYFATGLFLFVGRLLHLPFVLLYMFGKTANLLLYLLLGYLAIRRCAVGKSLLLVISLMPTSLFLAASYNRDAVLVGALLLGLSTLFSVWKEAGECADEPAELAGTWRKDMAVILLCFSAACLIKPIFAPLFFLVLFLPARGSKLLCVLVACIFLASFIVPALARTNHIGDSRGGNTDGVAQMEYLLCHKLRFAGMLWDGLREHQISYLIGAEALCNFGAYGAGRKTVLPAIFFILVAMFSGAGRAATVSLQRERLNGELERNKTESRRKREGGFYLSVFLTCLVIILFVWTAMYLSFTEVGNDRILGVQPRYFLPLVYPLLFLFSGLGARMLGKGKANLLSDRHKEKIGYILPVLSALLCFSQVYHLIFPFCV